MKQNKYDDEAFFNKYAQMGRSQNGLEGAGEWHELKKLLPNFANKKVLDLGCGFGWHCIYAAQQGASRVVGVDISEKMLQRARESTSYPNVEYCNMPIEDINFAPGSFDIVISSLALHYVQSFEAVCQKVQACLTPGGVFVFSVEHPIFTAHGTQDWYCDAQGAKLHWPVDRYFDEGERHAVFLGEAVVKMHKTLTTYLNNLLKTNFIIEAVVEPQPSPELLHTQPYMQEELRRPMMLLVKAHKA